MYIRDERSKAGNRATVMQTNQELSIDEWTGMLTVWL